MIVVAVVDQWVAENEETWNSWLTDNVRGKSEKDKIQQQRTEGCSDASGGGRHGEMWGDPTPVLGL